MTYQQLYTILKQKITEDYGKRCKDFTWGCINCYAWFALDFLKVAMSDEEYKKELKFK